MIRAWTKPFWNLDGSWKIHFCIAGIEQSLKKYLYCLVLAVYSYLSSYLRQKDSEVIFIFQSQAYTCLIT